MSEQQEVAGDAPIALYRFFNADGVLLYVGVTDNPSARFAEHAKVKSWWPDVARKTVTWCNDRKAAEDAEDAAIKEEQPLHNIRGKGRRQGVRAGGRGHHKHNPISLRFPEDVRAWLLEYAQLTGQPVNAVITQAFREYRERAEA